MSLPNTNHQVVLRRRPAPDVAASLFETVDAPMPAMGDGQFLVRNIYLSVDPAMRGWIVEAANYSDPVPLDGVMRSFAVGQIAKIKGCRTIGVTGSDEKARICAEEFGYDAVINYKTCPDLSAAIAAAAPDGVDCCFDNVGGTQLDAVLEHINIGARIAICGTIGMPSFPIPEGARMNRTLLVNRARIEGFLVLDHFDRFDAIIAEMTNWYREGLLKDREDVAEGLGAAPNALERLLKGENTGKQIGRVGPEKA